MRATNRPRCRKVAVKSWRRGQLHGRRIAAGQLTRVPGQSVPADEQRYQKTQRIAMPRQPTTPRAAMLSQI